MEMDTQHRVNGIMHISQVLAIVLLSLGVSVAQSEPPDVFKKTFPKIAGTHVGGGVNFGDPAVRGRFLPFLTEGVVRGSFHEWMMAWPSAKVTPPAPLW